MHKRETGVVREEALEPGRWMNGGIINVEQGADAGGELVWEIVSLGRKKRRGNESDEGCDSGRSQAWGSLKGTAREIEGVVGAITRVPEQRMESERV